MVTTGRRTFCVVAVQAPQSNGQPSATSRATRARPVRARRGRARALVPAGVVGEPHLLRAVRGAALPHPDLIPAVAQTCAGTAFLQTRQRLVVSWTKRSLAPVPSPALIVRERKRGWARGASERASSSAPRLYSAAVVVTDIDFTELGATTSLCGVCKRAVPAAIGRAGGAVVMRKRCPDHGATEVPVAADADWYARTIGEEPRLASPDPTTAAPVRQGCPFDCGPCSAHEQNVALPIVPITSACNLDCPICYTHNKNEGAWHMSASELEALLRQLRAAAPERRIINLTGGEPTMHPDFERLVALCVDEGIRRVTISTHGLRFLDDEALVVELARLRARIVLSFDAFDGAGNRALLGGDFLSGKRACSRCSTSTASRRRSCR